MFTIGLSHLSACSQAWSPYWCFHTLACACFTKEQWDVFKGNPQAAPNPADGAKEGDNEMNENDQLTSEAMLTSNGGVLFPAVFDIRG